MNGDEKNIDTSKSMVMSESDYKNYIDQLSGGQETDNISTITDSDLKNFKSVSSYDFSQPLRFSEDQKNIQKKINAIHEAFPNIQDQPLNDQEKKDRIDELDATINELSAERKKKAKENIEKKNRLTAAFQGESNIQEYNKKIDKLQEERDRLEEEIKPVTQKEITDVFNNYRISNDINDSEVLKKYGRDRTQKIFNAGINQQFEKLSKLKLTNDTPESILSYDNILYGKQEKPKFASGDQIKGILNKLREDPSYQRMMYNEKRKAIYQAAKEFVSTKENIEDKKKAAKQILNSLLVDFAKSENGNLTVEGTKLFAEHLMEQTQAMLEEYNYAAKRNGLSLKLEFNDPKNVRQSEVKISQLSPEKFDQLIGRFELLRNEYAKLKRVEKSLKDILETPEYRGGIRDVGKAIKSLEAENFALGVYEMFDALSITKYAKKIENGETPTFSEELALKAYATLNHVNSYSTQGKAYKITRGAALMVPYIAEFALSGGGYSVTKEAVKKSINPILRKYIGKKAGDITTGLTSRLAGTAVQTALIPQMYIKNTAENIRPEITLDEKMGEITYNINENSGDNLLKGATKGFATAYTEVLFERSGQHLIKTLPYTARLSNAISKKITGNEILKRSALDKFMKLKGIKSIASLNEHIIKKKLGWNGIFEEYLEEFAGGAVQNIIQGEKPFGTWEDQFVTLGTIALFGGTTNFINTTSKKIVGDNQIFTLKSGDKTKQVKIPSEMYKDFQEVLTESKDVFIDDKKFDAFMNKWQNKMNADQFKIFTLKTIEEGKNKIKKEAEKNIKGKKERKNIPEDYNENILPEEQEQEQISELSKQEIKQVNSANRKIIKEYPLLEKEGLLVRSSETGQYVQPTLESLQDMHKIVMDEIDQKSETDDKGTITNVTPELEKLIRQRDILEDYIDREKDKNVKFEDLNFQARQERLNDELKSGKKLQGKLTPIYNKSQFGIKLDDGRFINAYITQDYRSEENPKYIKENERGTKLQKAILNGEQVKLKRVPKSKWNKDNSAVNSITQIPYGDRVDVTLGNDVIGHVRITEDFSKQEKKINKEKENISDLTFKIDKFYKQKSKTPKIKRSKTIVRDKNGNIQGLVDKKPPKLFESDIEREDYHRSGRTKEYQNFKQFIEQFLINNQIELNKRYSYQEILSIVRNPDNILLNTIQKKFQSTFDKLNTEVIFVQNEPGRIGVYRGAEDTIYISLDEMAFSYSVYKSEIFRNNQNYTPATQLYQTFIHESIHAFTNQKINSYFKEEGPKLPLTDNEKYAIERLNKLFNYVKPIAEEQFYGLENIHEFIAESLSNPKFIKFIAEIEYETQHGTINMFKEFIDYILRLLGINKTYNSAYNELVNIADILAKNYDPQQMKDLTNEYQLLSGIVKFPPIHEVFQKNRINKENKNQAVQEIIDLINENDWKDIELEDAVSVLKQAYKDAPSLTDEDKGFIFALIDDNQKKIINTITKKKFKNKGLLEKAEILTIDNLIIPDLDGIAPSGSQKLENLLGSYSIIWQTIADVLDVTKDTVEREFYKIAKVDGIKSNLVNRTIFLSYLDTLDTTDSVINEIVKVLRRSNLNSIVSLFNIYSDIQLTKQYGVLYQKGNFNIRLLNQSQRYDQFIDNYRKRIQEYSYKGETGYKAVKRRIVSHEDQRDQLFNSYNLNWTYYNSQTPEKREELRRTQHQRDVMLLSEITGIPINIWNEYFSERTKETYAYPEKNAQKQRNYITYDNLLKYDTYRGKYPRLQSDIAFYLTSKGSKANNSNLQEFFDTFFTRGSEEFGVLSNIYKLSTISENPDEIGLNGIDIKGDRFNSFLQSSHMMDIAKNILENKFDNHVKMYYMSINQPMEISLINGIRGLDLETKEEGNKNVDMSNEDLWLTQLALFVQDGDTYMHWIGQFGDKPAIQTVRVPKFEDITEGEYNQIRKEFPEFDKMVEWFHDDILFVNSGKFGKSISINEDKRIDLSKQFIYNFIKNIQATNELFHGDKGTYKDLVEMVKRGGSTNSPGYRLNEYIEGGLGSEYTFIMVDDNFEGSEQFDGMEFFTSEYGQRVQISMGSILSKIDDEENQILTSVKALTSFIDPQTRLRGLTKGNMTNIDIIANSLPKGNKYEQLRNFMQKHNIDRLSFSSTTKKLEKVSGSLSNSKYAVKLWNEDGTPIKNVKLNDNQLLIRKTKDTYVQQDLRHSNVPKATKMPSQLHANMLIFDDGYEISKLLNDLQTSLINDIEEKFTSEKLEDIKIQTLLDALNENVQPEIVNLLRQGMTPYEPALANMMRSVFSGELTRKALEIPINRVTTQEIADADGLLQPRRYTSDKNHILLPDIAANIYGARYEDNTFDGKSDEAIKHVLKYKSKYKDLFDEAGELIEWEITERNGIIPGEPIISTRVPADDLHSHTVGRLKYKIQEGNFTMLDRISRIKSGSDFDGDQRFNQVFFKNESGNIIDSDSQQGIANKMMMRIVWDYSKPEYEEKIQNAIDTKTYDYIVDKYRKLQEKYSFEDPRGYDRSRNENIVGVKMKGILTDAVTTYSLINNRRITYKEPISLYINENKSIKLEYISIDPKGLIKNHLTNFLNLAFDNASDPKIEIMGFNEIIANMFVIALISNGRENKLDYNSDKAILKRIEDIVEYFNSPIVQKFTEVMRRQSGGLREQDMKQVESILNVQFGEEQTKQLLDFFYKSHEFSRIRQLYGMTQQAPNSISKMYSNTELLNSVKNNSKSAFRFINVRNLTNENGDLVIDFATAEDAHRISSRYIYNDTFFYSFTGQQIVNQIIKSLPKKKRLEIDEIESIDYGFNNIATLQALKVNKTAREVETILLDNIDEYRESFPDNEFLNQVQKVKRNKRYYFETAPDNRLRKIDENKLERIRNDFDIIYRINPELANLFATHTVYQFGTSTYSSRGGFYNLLGNKFRIDLSKKMSKELNKWQNGELESSEKARIYNAVLRGSRLEKFNQAAIIKERSYQYDIAAFPGLKTSISNEAIDALSNIKGLEDYNHMIEEYGFDSKALTTELKDIFNRPIQSVSKDIVPSIKALKEQFTKTALTLFPPHTNSGKGIKDMMDYDAVNEAFATEDKNLQNFIYNWLNKTYPTVELFKNRDKFFEFTEKWGNKGFNISPHAIGHAFKNAIYIDEERARQSTTIHELTHIYWDSLPKENKIKKAILDFFKNQYPDLNNDDLEEEVVLSIGRSGISIAQSKLNENLWNKFTDLLRRFWKEVKVRLGIYSKQDLIDKFAYDVWYNSHNIKPDSNLGSETIKSMISYNFSKDEIPGFEGNTHTHYIGKKPIPSVTTVITNYQNQTFDPLVQARMAAVRQAKIFSGLTGSKWTKEEIQKEAQGLYKLWNQDIQETGTAIHAVGEYVFRDEPTPQDIVDSFESRSIFLKTRNIFKEIKDNILEIYPDAIFYSESHIISKKNEIGGFGDLVVDTGLRDKEGNHEIIIYDFKTTNKPYADEDLKPLESYKQGYGFYKAPFQDVTKSKFNQHTLQLNMYANFIEEQESDINPGLKNVVKKLRIIPLVREIKNGKIASVNKTNWVKIPRNDRTKNITGKMAQLNKINRTSFNEVYPEFKRILEEKKVPGRIIDDMLKAFQYFSLYAGNLKKITKDHIGAIRNRGIQTLTSKLLAPISYEGLGYTQDDIQGQNSLTSEELFYITTENIKREDYMDSEHVNEKGEKVLKKGLRHSKFTEQTVYEYLKAYKNPERVDRRWHRYGDKLLKEEGIKTIQPGDEILRVYSAPLKSGDIRTEVHYDEVLEVNVKYKTLKVLNQETGDKQIVQMPDDIRGIYKIVYELPKDTEDPGKDSFVPTFLYKVEEKKEKHWNIKKEKKSDKLVSDESEQLKTIQQRKIWRFFSNHKKWSDIIKFFDNSETAYEFFNEFNTFDNEVSEQLVLLAREETTNHWMAEDIRKENNEYDKVPTHILRQTLNLYYVLTNHEDVVWNDFSRARAFRSSYTAREMELQYVPINMYTYGIEIAHKEYLQETYELNKYFKKFAGNVNYKHLLIRKNKTTYWKKPENVNKSLHPLEREFLEKLYEYYAKYDPVQKEVQAEGRTENIEVSHMWASLPEFTERFGKYGEIMHDNLRPQPYDLVKLNVIEGFDKEGQPIYSKDEEGRKIVRTLRQIKEDFSIETMDPADVQKFLGSTKKHSAIRILGMNKIIGTSYTSILNYQINKAKKIYESGEDADNLNIKERINASKRKMHIWGQGKLNEYSTSHLVEAEEKAIDSMIFSHFMKPLMGPLEFIYSRYISETSTEKGDIGKMTSSWIREWGDLMLYNIRPEKFGFATGEKVSNIIDFGNRMNSMNKILFSPITQINNLMIGQAMDFIREPQAMRKGWRRLFNEGNIRTNFKKAYNILRRYGLANIVNEIEFDKLDKTYKLFGIDLAKLENAGYQMMDNVEKLNQFSIFIGLMTEEEWNAYDNEGKIKNKKERKHLTNYRMSVIKRRVNEIHGDYGKWNSAPFWATNEGKAVMPFRKWLPTMIHTHIKHYQIDNNYEIRSGVFNTLKLLSKIAVYNLKTSEKVQQERQKKLQEMINKGEINNSVFFDTTKEYFQLLIQDAKGGKIKFKDLSENDRKNLWIAMKEFVALGLRILTTIFLFGAGDEKKYMTFARRSFTTIFNRFQGDVLWLYGWDNWNYLIQNAVPMLSLVISSGKFLIDFSEWIASFPVPSLNKEAKFNQDTEYVKQGTPKFLMDMTYVVPAGSAIRYLKKRQRIFSMKHKYYDVRDFGLDKEDIDNLGLGSYKVSEFDLKEGAMEWNKEYNRLKLAAQYYELEDGSLSPEDYVYLITGEKLLSGESNTIKDALSSLSLAEQLDENKLKISKEEINKGSREMNKLFDEIENKSKKQIIRKYEKILEEIENK